jgi:hypothetical protein
MKFLSAGRVVSERKTASGNCGSMISRAFGWLQGLLVIVENLRGCEGQKMNALEEVVIRES